MASATLFMTATVLDTDASSLIDFSLVVMTYFCKSMVGKDRIQSNLRTLYEHKSRVLTIANWDATETRFKITEEEALQVLKRHGSDTPKKFRNL
ncbi:hypothetical protein G6F42_028363 [Rhizopus arrhizus]|nr:hypothetical protein G6F42_028363 [Rhizopus arrhizus]